MPPKNTMGPWPGGVSPAADAEQAPPPDNPRFRSFAERYIIERCREWKEGEIDERSWAAILEAKSIYSRVREFSRNVRDT